MSNDSRPYRASYEGKYVTSHYDYPTKEMRAAEVASPTRAYWGEPHLTTVTSRKPVRVGEPVCWVNVYPNGPVAYMTVADANDAASDIYGRSRLHCIPVYLPGEGAVRGCTAECDTLRAEVQDWASRFKQAQQEVERLTRLNENLEFAMTDSNAQLASDTAELADLRREVERLTKQVQTLKDLRATENNVLSDAYVRQVDALKAERDTAQAEVERLTKELAAAQAQAMPAGKVVYIAMKLRGAKLAEWDFLTKERREIDCPKSCGWTWFTRVEES